ncbi:MAG: extracellular solute-binding protein [Oscillospiraceae bacterium]|nr:extracellular solute-binding protein [Oscillospiraceae bacterium]
MKHRKSNLIVFLLIGLLVISSIPSCSKTSKGAITASELFTSTEMLVTIKTLIANVEETLSIRADSGFNAIYLSDHPDTDSIRLVWSAQDNVFLSSVDLNGSFFTVMLEYIKGEPLSATQCSNNSLCLLTSTFDRGSFRTIVNYYLIASDGTLTRSGTLDDAADRTVIDVESDMISTVFVFLDDAILTLDTEGGGTKKVPADNSGILDFVYYSENELITLELDAEGGRSLSKCSVNDLKRKTVFRFLPEGGFLPERLISGGGPDECLYLLSYDKISEYNVQKATLTMLVTTSKQRLDLDIYTGMSVLSSREFILLGAYSFADSEPGLLHISLTEPSSQVKVLRLAAAIDDSSYDMETLAILFNQTYADYRIEVVYYNSYMNVIDGDSLVSSREEMILDVLGDHPPDLFCLPIGELEILAERGVLANISPIIDTCVENCSEKYLMNAVKAPEANGVQYYLTPFFNVSCFLIENEHFQAIEDFSLDGLMKYADLIHVPLMGNQYSHGFSEMARIYFVDRAAGKASLDSPDFLTLLNTFEPENNKSDPSKLLRFVTLNNFNDYITKARLSAVDFTAMGYPQGRPEPPIVSATMGYAVYKDSKHLDGADKFIEFLMSDTVQSLSTAFSNDDIPVSRSAMNTQIRTIAQRSQETDPGTIIHGGIDESDYLRALPPDQSWEAVFKQIVDSAKGFYISDIYLQIIFEEEMTPFIVGEKSAEETAAILQSRVGIYVAERAS